MIAIEHSYKLAEHILINAWYKLGGYCIEEMHRISSFYFLSKQPFCDSLIIVLWLPT